MITLVSFAVGMIVLVFFFRLFFKGVHDFLECVDLIEDSRAALLSDKSAECGRAYLKLGVYFALSVGSGFMTHYTLVRYFS